MSVLVSLSSVFDRIGLAAFGGGLATIPFIHFELVATRGWLTERSFSEVVSLAQMTPGPLALNAATYVGYRVAGVAGSFVATLSVILAPLSLLVAVLFLLSRASREWRGTVKRLQSALRPAVSGMMLAAFWMILRPLGDDWRLPFLAVCLFLARGVGGVLADYPLLLLLAAGVVGVLLL